MEVNKLTAEEQRVDRVVRAHADYNEKIRLNKLEKKGSGLYFLIYEKTPQFHDWYDVSAVTE